MAEKRLNCGINKTSYMTTNITVPDIGDFDNVEIIEVLTKPGSLVKNQWVLLFLNVILMLSL